MNYFLSLLWKQKTKLVAACTFTWLSLAEVLSSDTRLRTTLAPSSRTSCWRWRNLKGGGKSEKINAFIHIFSISWVKKRKKKAKIYFALIRIALIMRKLSTHLEASSLLSWWSQVGVVVVHHRRRDEDVRWTFRRTGSSRRRADFFLRRRQKRTRLFAYRWERNVTLSARQQDLPRWRF